MGVIAGALGLHSILATTCALIRINTFERKVTDILCEKRHDAAVVNILLHVHIAVIALVGCIFTHLRLMKEIL